MAELIGHVSDQDYQGELLRIFEGEFLFPSNDPHFKNGKFLGREFPIRVPLAIHPNTSGRIVINMPGRDGEIDGFDEKYKKLARHMQSQGFAAVIRTDNIFLAGYLPDVKLRAALHYAKEHAWEISGVTEPEIFLMGFSAGAGAIAAIAHEYPEVSRILLLAPGDNMGGEAIREGLALFSGDATIVIGDNDENVGTEAGQRFHDYATGAKNRELFILPDCDHQFRGEVNGRIMSEAPFYAFARSEEERPTFPDATGGIKLYD